ncbi:MYPC2 protein, partial [Eudromia elegans]|nr:MYPC2 protein [Eudromia elegans]
DPHGLVTCPPRVPRVSPGKDVAVVARVDGTQLAAKPGVKWFKGKWLELGSKSGARFQFKEAFDKESKVYTFELHISKVVIGDRGDYRCEVTTKDKKDSCSFNIDVEGRARGYARARLCNMRARGHAHAGGRARGYVRARLCHTRAGGRAGRTLTPGPAARREVQVEETKKKKKDEDDQFPPEIWELLKGVTKKSEYERIAFQYGITDLRGMLKRLKKIKVEPKKSEAFVRKLDPAYQVDKGNKIKLVVELSDPDLPLKWYKNGQLLKPSTKYVFENVGLKRILTIHKCSLADDAAYECRVNDEKCFTEVFVKEPPVTIEKGLDDQQVFVGERVVLEAEVSEEGAQVMWLKDGVELTREDAFKYRFKKDGKKHYLIINEATKEDTGHYKIMTNGGESEAEVIVEEKKLEVLQDIADLTVRAAEQAVFKCEVSDEKVTGKWYKNGVEVRPSKRVHMTHNGRFHKLVIDDVRPEDEGDYTFIPDGYALSLSAKLNFLEPPKIHLDCSGKTAENTIVVVAGNKLRLDVPITGEPAPTVTWMKGDEVLRAPTRCPPVPCVPRDSCCSLGALVFTETEGRAHLEQQQELSSFVIESAERGDEARYTIKVTNPVGEDSAVLIVKVVDVPDPPEAVRVTSVGEDWAVLVWEPPKFDGGQPEHPWILGGHPWVHRELGAPPEDWGHTRGGHNVSPTTTLAPTSEPTHLTLEDVTDTTATLKWRPPERLGAGGIDGYLVEYCREGSSEWIPANTELVERCGFTVKGLPTGERLLFRVLGVNIAGKSPPATLLQPVTIREIVERPKIRLPRHLRQTYVRKVGEQVNLVIPFQGKPRPRVTWTKGGQPLDKDVNIRTSDFDTIFFIRAATRPHSGQYELSVRIENMEDTARMQLRIVEKPGPPQAVQVKEVWGFNALLEWEPPKDDGNCEISGYSVQKADKKTMEWFTVYEHNRQPRCTVTDLVMGNEYLFRVYSENMCGLSEAAALSRNTARIPKADLILKPVNFHEHDFRTAPKFLTPLVDRTVVAGYSMALN